MTKHNNALNKKMHNSIKRIEERKKDVDWDVKSEKWTIKWYKRSRRQSNNRLPGCVGSRSRVRWTKEHWQRSAGLARWQNSSSSSSAVGAGVCLREIAYRPQLCSTSKTSLLYCRRSPMLPSCWLLVGVDWCVALASTFVISFKFIHLPSLCQRLQTWWMRDVFTSALMDISHVLQSTVAAIYSILSTIYYLVSSVLCPMSGGHGSCRLSTPKLTPWRAANNAPPPTE